MVTLNELNDLRAQAGSFFTPANRAEMEARLLEVLVEGLPDWDSAADTLLRRGLPLIAEQVEVWITTNDENVKQGLLAYAEGPLLDIFGLGPPVVRRRLGEADDPYRLRIANALTQSNLGSTDYYENTVRELIPEITDALAVVAPNRQNLRVFVAKADGSLGTADELKELNDYFDQSGTHIAGTDINVASPTQETYYINVTAKYDPTLYSEDLVMRNVETAVFAFIDQNRVIGRKIYLSALRDAAFTAETVDVTAAFAFIDRPFRQIPRRVSRGDNNLNVSDPTYNEAKLYDCPKTTTDVASNTDAGLYLNVEAV